MLTKLTFAGGKFVVCSQHTYYILILRDYKNKGDTVGAGKFCITYGH